MAEEAAEKLEKVAEVLKSEKDGLIDQVVGRIISRKFFVFLTATGLLTWANLDSDTWGMIAVVYIGSQAAVDIVKAYRESG